MTGCTGTLGELLGLSHQSSNLFCLCNLLQKVVICARFEGMQVVNYLANYQTTKVILTKGVPNKSGYMQMNKQGAHISTGIYSCSMRGTNIAREEGQWPPSNWPNSPVPETQTTALRLLHASLLYPIPRCTSRMIMTSPNDVRIICSPI